MVYGMYMVTSWQGLIMPMVLRCSQAVATRMGSGMKVRRDGSSSQEVITGQQQAILSRQTRILHCQPAIQKSSHLLLVPTRSISMSAILNRVTGSIALNHARSRSHQWKLATGHVQSAW